MQMNLSPSTEAFLASVVSSGAYRDRVEAIEAGIELLRSRTELMQRLTNSRAQLDRGEGVVFDEAGLADFFVALKERAVTNSGN